MILKWLNFLLIRGLGTRIQDDKKTSMHSSSLVPTHDVDDALGTTTTAAHAANHGSASAQEAGGEQDPEPKQLQLVPHARWHRRTTQATLKHMPTASKEAVSHLYCGLEGAFTKRALLALPGALF